MRFFHDDPTEYDVRWYFVDDDAPLMPYHTAFASGVYTTQYDNWGGVGEVKNTRKWCDGSPPPFPDGDCETFAASLPDKLYLKILKVENAFIPPIGTEGQVFTFTRDPDYPFGWLGPTFTKLTPDGVDVPLSIGCDPVLHKFAIFNTPGYNSGFLLYPNQKVLPGTVVGSKDQWEHGCSPGDASAGIGENGLCPCLKVVWDMPNLDFPEGNYGVNSVVTYAAAPFYIGAFLTNYFNNESWNLRIQTTPFS